MNLNPLHKLLVAISLLLATGIPGAMPSIPQYRAPSAELGWVIAQQGNRALETIRREAARIDPPTLPPVDAVDTLQARVD